MAHPEPAAEHPRARPRHAGALRDRLRRRRLLDLLRARPDRVLRARAHAPRLRDRRDLLRRDRDHLRRGHGPLPGGRRLVELLPACLQRGVLIRGRLGADAQLRRHDLDLGVLRPPLPVGLLGAAPAEPVGHRRRRRRDRAARLAQRLRRSRGGAAERRARRDRLLDPGAARRARRGPYLRSPHSDRGDPPRRRAALEPVLPGDPDRDDRLHRDGDDLQPGGGDPRPAARRAARLQVRRRGGVRDLPDAAVDRADGAAGAQGRRRRLRDPARPEPAARVRERPGARDREQHRPARLRAAGAPLLRRDPGRERS